MHRYRRGLGARGKYRSKYIKVDNLLRNIDADYLLVCATNEYLTEYSDLNENARYTLTSFSGSTGDALFTKEQIYLFVDGRYHIQADNEAKEGVQVIKLQLGQKQDEEIANLIKENSKFAIVAKKVSQSRFENFKNLLKDKKVGFILLSDDPINNYTEEHSTEFIKVRTNINEFKPTEPTLITTPEEVSYLTGLRDFSKDFSSKAWAKLFVSPDEKGLLFTDKKTYYDFLKNFDEELTVDKSMINAYEYSLIKYPKHKKSGCSQLKSVKTKSEISAYKEAFEATDKAVRNIRDYIEKKDNLSEYDISKKLREFFIKSGAKNLSFKSIVAINQHSALAHYSDYSKTTFLKDGDLVLIDCGAYYKEGLATDITRVFVKGTPSKIQKRVYTTVLKAFLNCYNSNFETGLEFDNLAHELLDNKLEGFVFNHGLGHGIGINVHENPPALNQSEVAKTEIVNGMTFTIEPGLYNKDLFGVRLENSCFKEYDKIKSFVKIGYEGKLIDYDLLTEEEKSWLKDFEIL